jgi:predicted nucleic acid-binding protein
VTALVIDASAGVEFLLDTERGREILAKIPSTADWWAPEHYFVEVAGALRRAELTKAAPSARVYAAFDALRVAPIRRAQVRPLLAEARSRRGNLTIGDALYVVLARPPHARRPSWTPSKSFLKRR